MKCSPEWLLRSSLISKCVICCTVSLLPHPQHCATQPLFSAGKHRPQMPSCGRYFICCIWFLRRFDRPLCWQLQKCLWACHMVKTPNWLAELPTMLWLAGKKAETALFVHFLITSPVKDQLLLIWKIYSHRAALVWGGIASSWYKLANSTWLSFASLAREEIPSNLDFSVSILKLNSESISILELDGKLRISRSILLIYLMKKLGLWKQKGFGQGTSKVGQKKWLILGECWGWGNRKANGSRSFACKWKTGENSWSWWSWGWAQQTGKASPCGNADPATSKLFDLKLNFYMLVPCSKNKTAC